MSRTTVREFLEILSTPSLLVSSVVRKNALALFSVHRGNPFLVDESDR
jgi:hypothetical protein